MNVLESKSDRRVRWFINCVVVSGCGLLLAVLLMWCFGCAQNTEGAVMQPTQQPTLTTAEQGALGSTTHVAPGNVWKITQNEAGRPESVNPLTGEPLGEQYNVSDMLADGAATLGNTRGTGDSQIIVFRWDIQSGGSQTGPQTTGATSGATATPGATITQTPEQKPEGSVQVPIAVALPGGVSQGSAAGATGQGTATLTPAQTAELRTALLRQAQAGDANAAALFEALFGALPPASQPSQ